MNIVHIKASELSEAKMEELGFKQGEHLDIPLGTLGWHREMGYVMLAEDTHGFSFWIAAQGQGICPISETQDVNMMFSPAGGLV